MDSLLKEFKENYFMCVEAAENDIFKTYDPNELIKNILVKNIANLSIFEVQELISTCIDIYKEYEMRNPDVTKKRKKADEFNEAFLMWENRYLSPE